MDYQELANIIKKEFPKKAIDIAEALELLKLVMDDTREAIGDKVNKSFSNNEYDDAKQYIDIAEEIKNKEKKIEAISIMFEIDDIPNEEEIDGEDKKLIPDYDEYLVDNKIEYTLYENFTHKRPYGFKIKDETMIKVKTWQDVLVETGEYLIKLDEQKFMGFEDKKSMNGKKRKYFSTITGEIKYSRKIANKIYISTNQSANSIRNLIMKMLKEYNISVSDFKIYLKADYTNLNEK